MQNHSIPRELMIDRDRVVPPKISREAARMLPRAEVVERSALGHLAPELIEIVQGQHVLGELGARGTKAAVLDGGVLDKRQQGIVVVVVRLQTLLAQVRPHRLLGVLGKTLAMGLVQ